MRYITKQSSFLPSLQAKAWQYLTSLPSLRGGTTKQSLAILTFLLLTFNFTPSTVNAQVTIDGNVTINGQTDHSGIMVVFERTNPSTTYDTTYTDAAGDYSDPS